ncbi:DUF7311 family protein [Haladaptatus caseinilyticus]|uniref:DUF7311 family protein n=1 Tax=Haladaptatus caseinilyticus TaxID=2993314 RepID=UPI00224AAFB1|nr:hypothetical protein [Haladaptatus caseinilyticus]
MSVRTVLAVVLAVVCCSISYPAIDDARSVRTNHHVDQELTRLENAMTDLVDESAVSIGDRGARRVVTLSVPSPSVTVADVEYVAIGGVPGTRRSKDVYGDVLAYRIEGGRRHVYHVPFDLRVAMRNGGNENSDRWRLEPDRKPLVIRDIEHTTIELLLVKQHGERVILVIRSGEL